jgi:hypothetical protein
MPFKKFFNAFAKNANFKTEILKICPKFRCAGVQILEDPNFTPMSSICFQPHF